MTLDRRTELPRSETDAFLGRKETGVLSLAREDVPYAIPISYGYDAAERLFFLRLVSTPDSEKRDYLRDGARATLVVYDEAEPVYRSVVATGTLEAVPREALTAERLEQYGETSRPLFEIWREAQRDLDVVLYQFDPGEVTGRRIEVDRAGDA